MRVHREAGGETITIAQSGVNSSSFQLPGWATFVGALFPAMDDGVVNMQLSEDNTNFYTVLDPADGAALVVVASGSDPGWMDLSDFLRYVPEGMYVRFVSATAQDSGAVSIKVKWSA